MKRIFIAILTALVALVALAQTPQAMLDKCVAAINTQGGVTANYSITTGQGTSKGALSMQGNKFRIISPEAKCWYDGKTQWSWSPVTSEVNITAPTADELQMTNPIAAVQHFKTNFNMKRAKAKTAKTYAIKLTPKKKKDNIVKAFLGSFRAGFWQTFGRFFGVSLKAGYHPDKDKTDAMIERICTRIEQGTL